MCDILTVVRSGNKIVNVDNDDYISLVGAKRIKDLKNNEAYTCKVVKVLNKLVIAEIVGSSKLKFKSIDVKLDKKDETLTIIKTFRINKRYKQVVSEQYYLGSELFRALRYNKNNVRLYINLAFDNDINIYDVLQCALVGHQKSLTKLHSNKTKIRLVNEHLEFHQQGIETLQKYLNSSREIMLLSVTREIINPRKLIIGSLHTKDVYR